MDEESCKIAPKFVGVKVGGEGECHVVGQSGGDTEKLTTYPRCNTLPGRTDVPFGTRCVLNSNECVEGEVFRETNHLPWTDPCHCYDVPTGMCYLTGVTPITADASFCAVGGYDCPDRYTFMSSAGLLNMMDPPRECRLCQEESASGRQELHESVVESGGCYVDDAIFLRCALESTECTEGETFHSSARMYELGHIPCPADDFPGGECTSGLDSVQCTNRAESCKFPPKFVPRDSCTMHSDREAGGDETWFGRCREPNAKSDYRWCVWGEAECNTGLGEVWYPAELDRNWLDGCNCENVKTGACRHDGEGAGGEGYYCAVSKWGCEDPGTYVSSGVLMENLGLDCRLCQPRRKVFMPTAMPVGQPVGQPLEKSQSETSSSSRSVPIGVIITFSLAMLIGLTIGAVYVYKRSKKKVSVDEGTEREGGVDDEDEVRVV